MAQATPPLSFAPALSSNALDKGQPLVGFNASAQGAGPDLGAWESGCPAPMYGPRPIGQESYFTPVDGCSATGGTGGAAGAGGTAGTGGAAGTAGTAGAGGMAGMGAMAGTSGAAGVGGGQRSGAAFLSMFLIAAAAATRRARERAKSAPLGDNSSVS